MVFIVYNLIDIHAVVNWKVLKFCYIGSLYLKCSSTECHIYIYIYIYIYKYNLWILKGISDQVKDWVCSSEICDYTLRKTPETEMQRLEFINKDSSFLS